MTPIVPERESRYIGYSMLSNTKPPRGVEPPLQPSAVD